MGLGIGDLGFGVEGFTTSALSPEPWPLPKPAPPREANDPGEEMVMKRFRASGAGCRVLWFIMVYHGKS